MEPDNRVPVDYTDDRLGDPARRAFTVEVAAALLEVEARWRRPVLVEARLRRGRDDPSGRKVLTDYIRVVAAGIPASDAPQPAAPPEPRRRSRVADPFTAGEAVEPVTQAARWAVRVVFVGGGEVTIWTPGGKVDAEALRGQVRDARARGTRVVTRERVDIYPDHVAYVALLARGPGGGSGQVLGVSQDPIECGRPEDAAPVEEPG